MDDLEKLDREVAQRVLKRVTWLAENFHRIVPQPLSGARVGDWRVIYTVEGELIVIRLIGHRREIYRQQGLWNDQTRSTHWAIPTFELWTSDLGH